MIRLNHIWTRLCIMAALWVASPGGLFGEVIIGAMAPMHMEGRDWDFFDRDLVRAKAQGVTAIATDVWWGMVEVNKDQFDFRYYDKLAEVLKRHGMKWIVYLSTHRAGGNVGDSFNQDIPAYLWTEKLNPNDPMFNRPESFMTLDEYGRYDNQSISPFAMEQFEDRFKNFYRQFARHFASYDGIIELNLSLGPSGELRFPSYLAGDPRSDFPTRGAFAFYGEAAANSFREFVLEKYGGLEGVNEAWKDILPSPLTNIEEIRVPDPSTLGNPDATTGFFAEGHHVKRYGKDLFDWYHGALIRSGELQLTWAAEVFKETFPGVPLSMKIPGVHWRTAKNSDRAAELAAGLISTGKSTFSTEPEKLGDAYESILSMVKRVTEKTGVEIVTVFTAVEMLDDPEAFNSKSMAESLAGGVIRLARSMGLKIYGENALAQSLSLPWAWDVMLRHFERGMNGVVLLRLQNVAVAAQNGHVKRFVDELVRAVRFVPTCAQSIARSLTSS